MPYCPNATKATVNYSFAGSKGRYISEVVPIEVGEKHKEGYFQGGQCDEWYGILYTSPFTQEVQRSSREGIGVKGPIFLLEKFFEDRNPGQTYQDLYRFAWGVRIGGYGGDDARLISGDPYPGAGIYYIFLNYAAYGEPQLLGLEMYNPYGDLGDKTDNCGDLKQTECTIEVKHNQQIIYSVTGTTPCDFNVTCDDECPPGTTKCHSDTYPGYCCLPCDSTRQSILGIKNIVKKVNKNPVSYG